MMKKTAFNANLDKIIDELVGKKIIRHTCQLLKKEEKGWKPHGSGVFAKIEETHYLITASHVIEDFVNGNQLFIRIGMTKYIPVAGDIVATDIKKSNNIDIAYIKLNKGMISYLERPYIFLPLEKVSVYKELLDATNYCIMGYPEKSKEKVNGKIEYVAQAYYVKPCIDKVYKYYNFDPAHFHLIEMKGKGIDIKTGSERKVDDHFYGLSGSGLWLIIAEQNGEEYSCDYRLIGIMSEFRKGKYFCMIGVKLSVFIISILGVDGLWNVLQNSPKLESKNSIQEI